MSKFATIDLAAGNSNVTLTNTTLSAGSITVNDGASGNDTVSAAGDTSVSSGKTLTYVTGMGTDGFTGGFENDAVHVSAAAVGGDTLTGGSGSNTLTVTSAGTVGLGGVSKFGTIDLAHRQQHGDGDRYDAVRWVRDDQRRTERQRHRQRGR